MFDLVPFRRNNISRRDDDFFNNFMRGFFDDDFFKPMNLTGNSFKVDLKETDDKYIIEADLPGVNKDAIEVSYENNYLTVSAKRDDVVEDKKDNYLRRERHYGEFRRAFYVDNIDENNIKASFKNGVLTIDLSKLEKENPKRKKIDIQ